MIKMIASDLDGTILLNGAQYIPDELPGLIRKLKEMGIFFIAASGRQYSNMYRNFAEVAEDMGFVCENGAVAFYKGELLYEKGFSADLAERITMDIQNREKSEWLYSTRDFYYVMPKDKEYYRMLTEVVRNDCKWISSMEEMELPCIKMAAYELSEHPEEVHRFWEERYGKECKVVTSGIGWVDFVPFGTNKAIGVQHFMKMLNVKPEECITFGDEFNDIEMLRCVPYGFAMKHAKAGVREAAPYEADNVLDMLKRLIEKNGEIEEVLKDVQ